MRRVILAAVLVSTAAFAQEAIETVRVSIPAEQRNAGVYTTPSWRVPLNASGMLTIRADIQTSDYEDVANRVIIRFYVLDESTQQWRKIGGNDPDGWVGGQKIGLDGTLNPPIEASVNLFNYRDQQIRGEAEVFRRMRVGVTIYTMD